MDLDVHAPLPTFWVFFKVNLSVLFLLENRKRVILFENISRISDTLWIIMDEFNKGEKQ